MQIVEHKMVLDQNSGNPSVKIKVQNVKKAVQNNQNVMKAPV